MGCTSTAPSASLSNIEQRSRVSWGLLAFMWMSARRCDMLCNRNQGSGHYGCLRLWALRVSGALGTTGVCGSGHYGCPGLWALRVSAALGTTGVRGSGHYGCLRLCALRVSGALAIPRMQMDRFQGPDPRFVHCGWIPNSQKRTVRVRNTGAHSSLMAASDWGIYSSRGRVHPAGRRRGLSVTGFPVLLCSCSRERSRA